MTDYLTEHWGSRENVRELQRQYGLMAGMCPWVMRDLAALCHAEASTADPDNVNRTFLNEGRREVWLHIQAMLRLREEDIQHVPASDDQDAAQAAPDLPPPEPYEEDDHDDGKW